MKKIIAVLCVAVSVALLCGASGCASTYSEGPPPARGSSSKLGRSYGMSVRPAGAEVAVLKPVSAPGE